VSKGIETKVVNRLRQAAASMNQEGENRVAIIRSESERKAAEKMSRAAAVRPRIVGRAGGRAKEPRVAQALSNLLDVQATLKSPSKVTLVPKTAKGRICCSIERLPRLIAW
jgi:regulator of protease activity HflC (stomatin/prohibitin superfamily)